MAISIVRKIRSLFRRPLRSSIEVAAEFLPRRIFEEIFISATDRRIVLTLIAKKIGVDEGEFIRKIASRLKIPALDRLSPFPLQVLPVGLTVSDLRKAGASLTVSGGAISGIVCVDPEMVEKLLLNPKLLSKALPISLCSWRLIAQTLAESEEAFVKSEAETLPDRLYGAEAAASYTEPAVVLDKALSALAAMLTEAKKYDVLEVHVSKSEEVIRYGFTLADGKKASGTVSPALHREFSALLHSSEKEFSFDGKNFFIKHVTGESLLASHQQFVEKELVLEVLEGGKKDQEEEKASAHEQNSPASTPSEQIPDSWKQVVESKPKIVIVDDNPSFAKILERFLSKQGFEIAHALDGERGLALIAHLKPDAIICDVHMPSMNGFEFLKRVKLSPQSQKIPVIMLTSDDTTETQVTLLESGAEAFVPKSSDPRILSAHINRILKKSEAA